MKILNILLFRCFSEVSRKKMIEGIRKKRGTFFLLFNVTNYIQKYLFHTVVFS